MSKYLVSYKSDFARFAQNRLGVALSVVACLGGGLCEGREAPLVLRTNAARLRMRSSTGMGTPESV